uniref:Myoneurin n=1 Tax=Schistocephalus solidus TaxID=70667 RepID=A0A0X3PM27_SCHSO
MTFSPRIQPFAKMVAERKRLWLQSACLFRLTLQLKSLLQMSHVCVCSFWWTRWTCRFTSCFVPKAFPQNPQMCCRRCLWTWSTCRVNVPTCVKVLPQNSHVFSRSGRRET